MFKWYLLHAQATTVTLASVANNARMIAPAMDFATMVNASVILHGMEMTVDSCPLQR